MSFDDALEVPDAKSSRSTNATAKPWRAASSAHAGADDPPADDEQIESLRPQPLEAGRTRVLHPRRTLPVAAAEADTRNRSGDTFITREVISPIIGELTSPNLLVDRW